MNVLEHFAGAGGGIQASRSLGHQVVGAVELDAFCREILLRRQEEGNLEPFPVFADIRRFRGIPWRGVVDIVAAGFPCQPWSVAGNQQGEFDSRNLWPETRRVIEEVEPGIAWLENVPGLLSKAYFWETILPDLAQLGFDARWEIVSARDVGAPHLRKRVWIYCEHTDANRRRWEVERLEEHGRQQGARRHEPNGLREGRRGQGAILADAAPVGSPIRQDEQAGSKERGTPELCGGWNTEPGMGRVADGLAYRVDRLKALGNGQVPQCVVEAWHRLRA